MLQRTTVIKTELASQSGSPLVLSLLQVLDPQARTKVWHVELEKAGALLGAPIVHVGDAEALDAYQSLVRWATTLSRSGAL